LSIFIGSPCRHPQALGVDGRVNNDTGTELFETFPCVVWEIEGLGIVSRFFYPGDDRSNSAPPDWYSNPAGFVLSSGFSAARPSAVVDNANRVVVAWEESSGGNFDIFLRRADNAGLLYSVRNGPVLIPEFISAVNPGTGAPGSWATVSGSLNVSATPTLSIQPSVTIDGGDFIWVAWQESVGAEREIYVRTSDPSFGGGSWPQAGGSATAGGVSSTAVAGRLTTSSFPSIAASPSFAYRPVVAWEDDAGGNHDIYVRQLNPAGTGWVQVGD
jgi:hypothetical protein